MLLVCGPALARALTSALARALAPDKSQMAQENRDYIQTVGQLKCMEIMQAHVPVEGCNECFQSVEKGCWIWGHNVQRGYGRITVGKGRGNQVQLLIHRVALAALDISPPDKKAHASHRCNTSNCFNPEHIVWESHDANQDRKNCPGYLLCSQQL